MRSIICFLMMLGTAVLQARPITSWDYELEDIALEEDIPANLLSAICWVESRHQPKAINLNDNGSPSIGLCQIKLATARKMGFVGTAKGLQNGKTNARYAAKYIKYQLIRYSNNWAKAIAAYNAGSYIISRRKNPGKPINQGYVDLVTKAITACKHCIMLYPTPHNKRINLK